MAPMISINGMRVFVGDFITCYNAFGHDTIYAKVKKFSKNVSSIYH